MEEFSSPSWVHCSSQLITIYTYNALKKRPWKEVYPWLRHDCNNNPMYGIRSQIIQRLVKLLFFFQSWLLVANVNREATSVLVMAFGFIGKTLKTSLWRVSSEMQRKSLQLKCITGILNPNELIHYVHIFLRWVQRSHVFKSHHVYDAQILLYHFHKENPMYKQDYHS